MKVTIKNTTEWNTNELRALYRAALDAAGARKGGAVGGQPVAARLTVEPIGRRKRNRSNDQLRNLIRGFGYYGTHGYPGRVRILLPSPAQCLRTLTLVPVPGETGERSHVARIVEPAEFRDRVARVMHHEALHAVGARHKEMTQAQLYCTQDVPWAAALTLHPQPAAPEATEQDPAERRAAAFVDKLDHARSMLKRAATRRKRATTIEKSWARVVKRLERRA